MPKPIQNPRVGQALAREFGLVGRVHPSLDEVVVPVVLAGDVRSVAAPKTREAVIRGSQAAVAAEFAVIRLETPPGTMARVRLIHVNPDADSPIHVHFGALAAGPFTLQGSLSFTDGRVRRDGVLPGVRLGLDTVAALPATAAIDWSVRGLNQATEYFRMPPFTMGQPDAEDFVEFYCGTANTAFTAQFWFEEFPYQTSLAG